MEVLHKKYVISIIAPTLYYTLQGKYRRCKVVQFSKKIKIVCSASSRGIFEHCS